MESSRTITLFAELPPVRRGPSPFVVSILLHCVVMGLMYLGLKHAVKVEDDSASQRYTVRLLNLRSPEPEAQRAADSSAARMVSQAAARAIASGGHAAAPSVPRELAQLVPAPQTLVQPDLPPNLLLPQATPIPMALMWSPENTPLKKIVPPPVRTPAPANVRPSLEAPNHESNVADLKISATAFVTKAPALPPSNTSPLAVLAPQPAKQLPATASKATGPPAPARVMSLSDLQLEEGTVALPMVNETARAGPSGIILPGRADDGSEAGTGNPASQQSGKGPGQEAGDRTDKTAGAANPGANGNGGAKPGSGAGLQPTSGSGSGSVAEDGSGNERSVAHIALPKDGHFGVVVVGPSLAEKYPETVGLWNGRLAYTVYLRVGLARNWILQYSLPPAAEASTPASVTRPDAPWPYSMERPTLAPGDSDGDAVMVHGFVNNTGRFEKLAVVFPPEFAQAKFVLSALQQWQFRPALQNGKLVAVEVLLIIPEEPE